MKDNKVTREHIKKAAEYIFNGSDTSPPKERKIKFYSYCKGINGPRSYGTGLSLNLCDHPECVNCRNIKMHLKKKFNIY